MLKIPLPYMAITFLLLTSCHSVSSRREAQSDGYEFPDHVVPSEGYVHVKNGQKVTAETRVIYDEALLVDLPNPIGVSTLVERVGPGYIHQMSSAGVMTWYFSDGTEYSAWITSLQAVKN